MGAYSTAAKNREQKIFRAINSVCRQQTKHKIELIGIIDSCEISKKVLKKNYDQIDNPDICSFYNLEYKKDKNFNACKARNAGIDKATGDIICYLDIDDYFMMDHVEKIVSNFTGLWIYFDAWNFNPKKNEWYRSVPNIHQQFQNGTWNFAHSINSVARWKVPAYGWDDWAFLCELKYESEGKYIGEGSYRICHWPGAPYKYDV